MSSFFLVTSYGITQVILTSLVDMPGWIIDMLVSKKIRFAIPSISTEIVGAPNSNRTETR
jgi:hypothetical protein